MTYYTRYIELPMRVEGVTLPNDDGSFDIYINASLPPDRQEAALRHELEHIRQDHLYDDARSVVDLEQEARDTLLKNTRPRVIPCITISA